MKTKDMLESMIGSRVHYVAKGTIMGDEDRMITVVSVERHGRNSWVLEGLGSTHLCTRNARELYEKGFSMADLRDVGLGYRSWKLIK